VPTRLLEGGTPVVEFDPRYEVSPYALFRRLKEGPAPVLIDVRAHPEGTTLRGAQPLTADWMPPAATEVVLFDEDGTHAVPLARELQAAGHERVRALFGGLELYGFALDPEVVGAETFLIRI
jgi:hypothetical protein